MKRKRNHYEILKCLCFALNFALMIKIFWNATLKQVRDYGNYRCEISVTKSFRRFFVIGLTMQSFKRNKEKQKRRPSE